MNKSICVILFGISSALVATGRAEDERSLPDTFAITYPVTMTEKDELYVTPSANYFKLPDEKHLTLNTEFYYGIFDKWELFTAVPYEFVNPNHDRSVSGLGDVEIGSRYSFLEFSKDSNFALNAGLRFGFPTGSRNKGFSDGRVIAEPFVVGGAWLGPINVQGDLAWSRGISQGGTGPENEFEYSVAVVYPIRPVFLVVEGSGATTRDETEYYITPGAVWKINDDCEIRASVPIGVTRAAGDYGIIVGATFAFDNLFHRSDEKH